jgi:hypothetical protein
MNMENEINGFFDDDGNKTDPFAVPKSDLCIVCKLNDLNDSEEDMFCAMNRWDQKDKDDFKCGMFERKD